MAKNCNLIWSEEGYLICTVQHTKAKCDLDVEVCEHGYPKEECEDVC